MESFNFEGNNLIELAEKARRKELFTIPEQIEYLKYKGISISKEEEKIVEDILTNRTYYFKVTAYRKNFNKDSDGKYLNLTFLQLADLAKIDMYLRMILGKMIFEIEHSLKTLLIKLITESNIDGYAIVNEFDKFMENLFLEKKLASINPTIDQSSEQIKQLILQNYISISKKIMNNINGEFGYDVDFYKHHHQRIAVWALVEIMSLGQLNAFIIFYCEKKLYGYNRLKAAQKILRYVTNVRNACAHNRPLIYNILDTNQFYNHRVKKNGKNNKPSIELTQFVNHSNIDYKYLQFLTNKKINDIVSVIYLHDTYIHTKEMKQKNAEALTELLIRIQREKDLYQNNPELVERFFLFHSIVTFYYNKNK